MFIAPSTIKEQIFTIKLLTQASIQGDFGVISIKNYKEGCKVKKEEDVGATYYFLQLVIENFLKTKIVKERQRHEIN